MAVPYTFGSATTSIPLSQLDSNFATPITLGNTAVQLGNTITTLTGITNLASSGALTLGSNGNTTAIYVDTSQNVGIGTNSPSTYGKLAVVGSGFGGGSANFVSTSSGNFIQVTGVNGALVNDSAFYNFTDGTYNAFIGLTGTNATPVGSLRFATGTSVTERMRITSGGLVGIGRTPTSYVLETSSTIQVYGAGSSTDYHIYSGSGSFWRYYATNQGAGLHFTGGAIFPANYTGGIVDNQIAFGSGGYRYTAIYAVNGTIQTSDANDKTEIADLDEAEKRVAVALKGMIKKFKMKDAVEKKGSDGARIHVGWIAQEVAAAFEAEGLDPYRYGAFCSDTWYEVDGSAIDEKGYPITAETEGAIERTRVGLRTDEVMSFIISVL